MNKSRFVISVVLGALGLVAVSSPVSASETITYTYDARGRLVQVVHSGTVNNGVTVQYEHDKANNRKTVTTTGSSH